MYESWLQCFEYMGRSKVYNHHIKMSQRQVTARISSRFGEYCGWNLFSSHPGVKVIQWSLYWP